MPLRGPRLRCGVVNTKALTNCGQGHSIHNLAPSDRSLASELAELPVVAELTRVAATIIVRVCPAGLIEEVVTVVMSVSSVGCASETTT